VAGDDFQVTCLCQWLVLTQIYVLYLLIILLDTFHIWTVIQWYCRTYFSSWGSHG